MRQVVQKADFGGGGLLGRREFIVTTLACAAFGLQWPNDVDRDRTYPDFEESLVADLHHPL
jgi:hypothetical protein